MTQFVASPLCIYKYHPKRIHCGPLALYDPSSSSIYIYILIIQLQPITLRQQQVQTVNLKVLFWKKLPRLPSVEWFSVTR